MTDYEWDVSQYAPGYGPGITKALDNLKPARSEGTLKERKLKELNGLLAAAQLLEERITKVTLQVETLTRFPEEDPYPDGVTLEFTRNFPNGKKTYDYAARRIQGLWYCTGTKSPQAATWNEFINWLGLGLVGELEVVKRPARRKRS